MANFGDTRLSLALGRPSLKPEYALAAQRPRKRLQKPFLKHAKQPSLESPTRPAFDVFDIENKKSASVRGDDILGQTQPSLPERLSTSADLDKSKWPDSARNARRAARSTISPSTPKGRRSTSTSVLPEFTHLSVADSPQRHSMDDTPSTPVTPMSSESAMIRRHAKTPVFRVGQLEGSSHDTGALRSQQLKRQSADIITQERDLPVRDSALSGPRSAPLPTTQHVLDSPSSDRRQRSPSHLSRDGAPPTLEFPQGSPTSDDGTLVSFEEETIYFKPMSFSPEPSSPMPYSPSPYHHDFNTAPPSPYPTPNNLSLQICIDLLSRELSSAVCERPNRQGTEVTSLQIWVMIEAYERLRDQIYNGAVLGLPAEQLQPIEEMFDTWLRALYAIHDSLAGDARSRVGELDSLPSEDLD